MFKIYKFEFRKREAESIFEKYSKFNETNKSVKTPH